MNHWPVMLMNVDDVHAFPVSICAMVTAPDGFTTEMNPGPSVVPLFQDVVANTTFGSYAPLFGRYPVGIVHTVVPDPELRRTFALNVTKRPTRDTDGAGPVEAMDQPDP